MTLYFTFIFWLVFTAYILRLTYGTVYNLELTMYFVILMSAALVHLIITLILSNIFKVRINSKWLHSVNIWGVGKYVNWQDITKVKYLNFFGLKYLRVFSLHSRSPIWIPLFIKNKAEFRTLLKNFYSGNYKFIQHIK